MWPILLIFSFRDCAWALYLNTHCQTQDHLDFISLKIIFIFIFLTCLQQCSSTFLIISSLKKDKAFICSICSFLWRNSSQLGQFQSTTLTSLNTELGRDAHSCLWQTYISQLQQNDCLCLIIWIIWSLTSLFLLFCFYWCSLKTFCLLFFTGRCSFSLKNDLREFLEACDKGVFLHRAFASTKHLGAPQDWCLRIFELLKWSEFELYWKAC